MQPISSFFMPYATGLLWYTWFHTSPSILTFSKIHLARSSKLVSSSNTFTSKIIIDLATPFALTFLASSAYFFIFSFNLAASSALSSSSPKRSKSSSFFLVSVAVTFYSTFFSSFFSSFAGA